MTSPDVIRRGVTSTDRTSPGLTSLGLTSTGLTSTDVADDGTVGAPRPITDLAEYVAAREPDRPRWVWSDTSIWYPGLLHAGVRVERSVDLRLSHLILRHSSLTASSALARAGPGVWDAAPETASVAADTLFDVDIAPRLDPLDEFVLQREAVAGSVDPGRIRRLLAAESAGALAAEEMRYAGLPWRREVHERLLEELLGPRPTAGRRPERMQRLAERIRIALDAPTLNPDSSQDLLAALNRAGIRTQSTRSGELERVDHPAIPVLLEYKKLARLMTANGWTWVDANIVDGRFHPEYVPGAVVTGRWASRGGGGALQLPRQIRSAVVADTGWRLVVADAAQLEPRILAAMAGDTAMIDAGAGGDLYAGILAGGAVASRDQAKVAMLAAMYGATSGEAGRLLPRLARAYPRAIAMVEAAARTGERGGVVTTRLGRSSPTGAPAGYDETADADQQSRARERARARGRFTRNFIVQGTAAEWALCWIAGIRPRLHAIGLAARVETAPHLVFFVHDEVVVHTPAELAAEVEGAIVQAAAEAGRLLFGAVPAVFPVVVATVDDYASAK